MPKHNLPRKPLHSRGWAFKALEMAAFHRGLRNRCLAEAREYRDLPGMVSRCLAEARRHEGSVRFWVRHSAGSGYDVVLP